MALLQLGPGYRRVLALPRLRARMEAMVMAYLDDVDVSIRATQRLLTAARALAWAHPTVAATQQMDELEEQREALLDKRWRHMTPEQRAEADNRPVRKLVTA